MTCQPQVNVSGDVSIATSRFLVCVYIYGICGKKIVPTCRLKQAEICAVYWMSTLSARELVCAKGWRDVSLSPSQHNVLYISAYLQVKLLCYRLLYGRLLPHSSGFATLKTSPDPDIYTS